VVRQIVIREMMNDDSILFCNFGKILEQRFDRKDFQLFLSLLKMSFLRLGNRRGNIYSTKHIRFPLSSLEFWNYR
jgi:hypothetical protein